MNLKIKQALDAIQPDEALLRNTAQALRAQQRRSARSGRRLVFAAASLLLCAGLFGAGWWYFSTPVTSLYVDINPSLVLQLDRRNSVAAVQYLNDDARGLIEESALRGKTADQAVDLILAAASQAGYLSNSGTSYVSLASYSADVPRNTQQDLLNGCAQQAESEYKTVSVYSSTVDSALKAEAEHDSISAGKLELIKMIQQLDRSATVDQYRHSSVTGIMNHLLYLTSDSNTAATDTCKQNVQGRLDDMHRRGAHQETSRQDDSPDADQPKSHSQTGDEGEPEEHSPAAQEGSSSAGQDGQPPRDGSREEDAPPAHEQDGHSAPHEPSPESGHETAGEPDDGD